MTRIIIIGNSHVGAFKAGWDAIAADHPGIEVDFFAAGGRNFRRFRLLRGLEFGLPPAEARKEDAVLDASGRASIDLRWADHVLWVGYLWPWDDVAELMRDFDIEGLREVGAPQVLSRAAFNAFCNGIAEQLAPPPVWRNWTRPTLTLHPAPMRSADCLTHRAARFRPFHFLAQNPAGGREVIDAFSTALAHAMKGHKIDFLAQPLETMLPSGLSDLRFARGARKILDPNSSIEDVTHLNAEYGRLVLGEFLSRLAPAQRPPAEAVAL